MLKATMRPLHGWIYRHRLEVLSDLITPHLKPGDRVLDIGCGFGALGRRLLDDRRCPRDVHVRGLERFPRGHELIEVTGYDGTAMPFDDRTFDVVILADVIHHDEEPDRLIVESVRICRRLLIIKDHQVKGPLAQSRIGLIDWAANAPYGVKCLYRYNSPQQWAELPDRFGLQLIEERRTINLYPAVFNLFFGRSLQFFAVYGVGE